MNGRWMDSTRSRPSAVDLADARLVCRTVLAAPGLSAAGIARRLAAAGRPADGRRVRRLVYVARCFLAAPIVARAGGHGYWIPTTAAEAVAYAARCRRIGRDHFRLAAMALARADLAGGGQFHLDIGLRTGGA